MLPSSLGCVPAMAHLLDETFSTRRPFEVSSAEDDSLGFEALGGGRTKRSLSETSSRPSGFVMAGGAFRRAASHGRNIASSLGAVIRVPGRQRSAPDSTTLNPAVSLEVMKVRPPEGKATFANSATGRWRQRAYQGPEDFERLRSEMEQLQKELEHQMDRRRALQASLDSERSRTTFLDAELSRAYEGLQGQRRMSDVETQELGDQVEALLLVKRQLFQRIQSLEQERSQLLSQQVEAVSDRSCVACLDRLANTVLLRCRHLCCCEGCARRMTQCPVCRQSVRDRITVFMP